MKKTILVFLPVLLLAAMLQSTKATLVTLDHGVYWDIECTQPAETTEWGTVYPYHWYSKTFYIRNEDGCFESYMLQIEQIDPPDLLNYIRVRWNLASQIEFQLLGVPFVDHILFGDGTQIKEVTLAIFIEEWASPVDFSFDINIEVSMTADIRGSVPPNYPPDGIVDMWDFGWIGKEYGTIYTPYMVEDVDRNGEVNMQDVYAVQFSPYFGCYISPYHIEEDVNLDNWINYDDMDAILEEYGVSYDVGYIRADLDHDGDVDIRDFGIVGQEYGKYL